MKCYVLTSLIVLLAKLVLTRNMIPDNDDNLDNQKTTEKSKIHTGLGYNESSSHTLSKNKSNIVTTPKNDSKSNSNDILQEWGGNCTKKHWDKCSHLDTWVVKHYVDVKKPDLGFKYHETDCTLEPIFCLTNGWTVTRCQLLCMQCNKDILKKYDKYVRKEGVC